MGRRGLVEDTWRIDINKLNRLTGLSPGLKGSWTWDDSSEVGFEIGDGAIKLFYTVVRKGSRVNIEYLVSITYTECNYGGRRPWFVCPKCKGRVGKLYYVNQYFLCRKCQGLAYESQLETPDYRLMRKIRKIRKKSGGSRNLDDMSSIKPKGMHWRTYERLMWRSIHLERRLSGELRQELSQMAEKSRRSRDHFKNGP